MDLKKLFMNRQAVLATMHKKEQVIAPILTSELGLSVVVPENFNSDSFGTFTNEVERTGDQLEAARKKIETALLQSGFTIGIASEGSFGPHPIFSYVPMNRELILFVDKEQELEIIGYVANGETNFAQKEVKDFEEAYEFALSVGFPEHGVIVKKHAKTTNSQDVIKGITTVDQLKKATSTFVSTKSLLKKPLKPFFIETDMRAMYNPTRMKNIKLATLNLLKKMNSLCPSCDTPGFDIKKIKKGLRCLYCGLPTDLVHSHFYECKKCQHEKEVLYPDGKEKADPKYCNFCNP